MNVVPSPITLCTSTAAVVLGDNLLAGRQPQSGALHLGGVNRLEYLFQSLRTDTRPGINNGYLRCRTHDRRPSAPNFSVRTNSA